MAYRFMQKVPSWQLSAMTIYQQGRGVRIRVIAEIAMLVCAEILLAGAVIVGISLHLTGNFQKILEMVMVMIGLLGLLHLARKFV